MSGDFEGNELHANCTGTSADLLRMAGMLEKNPGLIDHINTRPDRIAFCGELTPLQSAVYCRHVACVQFLIERGANLESRNSRGFTALYIAIYGKNLEMVRLLLEHGANPNYDESLTQTPTSTSQCKLNNANYLHMPSWYFNFACEYGFFDIMEILLSYGAKMEDKEDPLLSSPAHSSVRIKRPDCLLLVLRNGALLNYCHLPPEYQTHGNVMTSVLHSSITPHFSSPDSVEILTRIWTILREFGEDFYFKDEEGLTPLQRLRSTYMPYNHNEPLERILVEMMSQPLSLQSLCRIKIRRCMGIDCHKRLHLITNIPRDIRAYLNYDKFEKTLDSIQFQR